MKRTLATITTGIVALGLAVVGFAGSASASGPDDPAPMISAAPVSDAETPAVTDSAAPVTAAPAATTLAAVTTAAVSTPAAACVSSATWAYTFSNATASGIITASSPGVAAGTALCSPLYVRAASWNYDLPTDGNNPSFPQTLDAKQDVTVTAVGVPVAYAAPDVIGQCQQHDIYGTFSARGFTDLFVPTNLVGPNKPYEPEFLHSALNGKGATGPDFTAGPTPTYTSDSSVDCAASTPALVTVGGDPMPTNPVCAADGSGLVSGFITVVGSPDIRYTVHNVADGAVTTRDIIAGVGTTNLPSGSYTVTAAAMPGFILASTVPVVIPLEIAAAPADCGGQLTTHALLDPAVTAVGPVCSNGTTTSGSLQIDPADGVNYFIGTTQLTAASTPEAPGTYSVLAVAADPVNDAINTRDPNPISVEVTPLATGCSQLTTLALDDGSVSLSDGSLASTGGSGPSILLIVSATLLLLSGALIALTQPRRARRGLK